MKTLILTMHIVALVAVLAATVRYVKLQSAAAVGCGMALAAAFLDVFVRGNFPWKCVFDVGLASVFLLVFMLAGRRKI